MIAAIYARKSTEQLGVKILAKLAKALRVTVAEVVAYVKGGKPWSYWR